MIEWNLSFSWAWMTATQCRSIQVSSADKSPERLLTWSIWLTRWYWHLVVWSIKGFIYGFIYGSKYWQILKVLSMVWNIGGYRRDEMILTSCPIWLRRWYWYCWYDWETTTKTKRLIFSPADFDTKTLQLIEIILILLIRLKLKGWLLADVADFDTLTLQQICRYGPILILNPMTNTEFQTLVLSVIYLTSLSQRKISSLPNKKSFTYVV